MEVKLDKPMGQKVSQDSKPISIEYMKEFAEARKVIPFSNADEIDVHIGEWYQRIDCINNGIVKNITVFAEPSVILYENVTEVYSDEFIVGYRFGLKGFNVVFLNKELEKQERDMYSNHIVK